VHRLSQLRRSIPLSPRRLIQQPVVMFGQTSIFYDRADVSASFGSQLPPSGWIIRAKLQSLGRGSHQAHVVLISASGTILGNLNPQETRF
jgi:hypothetical protein